MRIIFICLFYYCFGSLCAQSNMINSPFLISSAGETFIQTNYNMCFSVGEIAVETLMQSDAVLTQGFHQENYEISQINELENNHKISIYPNPTQDILQINCNISTPVDLKIIDIKGSIISSLLKAPGAETQLIDLSKFSQGVYFLEIIINTNSKQVYQIQKFN